MQKEFFDVVRLSRDDFEMQGFNASQLTDAQMERVASKIGDVLVENMFWECIEHWADELNLPANNNGQHE